MLGIDELYIIPANTISNNIGTGSKKLIVDINITGSKETWSKLLIRS